MSKKSILIVLFLLLLSVGGFTLYSTFAYNEEEIKLEDSNSDYNLIYSLRDNSNKNVSVSSHEEKYIDFELNNIYPSNVMYGMYYYLVSPSKMPSGVEIKLSEESDNPASVINSSASETSDNPAIDIIKSGETKVVSIRIKNDSEDNIDLIVGALIGFENGDINDLVKNGEFLIK